MCAMTYEDRIRTIRDDVRATNLLQGTQADRDRAWLLAQLDAAMMDREKLLYENAKMALAILKAKSAMNIRAVGSILKAEVMRWRGPWSLDEIQERAERG